MKHLRRKACSLLCILALLTSLVPMSAWASDLNITAWQEPTPPTTANGSWTEENNYNTSWYDDNPNAIEFTLNDAADLAGLAVIVNGLNGHAKDNFADKTITLADNGTFNLSAHTWTPIGTSSSKFAGIFDGSGATITGLTILNASRYNGLFALVNSATIKNVTLTNGYISISLSSDPYIRVGGIVGHVTGTTEIENCSFEGTIDASDGSSKKYNNIGGIVGETDSQVTIENCRTNGKIFGNGYYMGGIVGCAGGTSAGINVTITDCTNEAEIRPDSSTAVGGIIGYSGITGILTVTACVNNEDITPTVSATNFGGIVGRINGAASAAITGCTNTAALTSGNSENMGGIVGYSNQSTTITDCHNSGTVTNSSVGEYPELTYTGGILGRMETKDLSVKQCSNQGAVSGSAKKDAHVGGIVGQFYRVGGNIEECYNAGACTVTRAQNNAFVGGLIGDSSNNSSAMTLQNSYNVGTISNAESSSYRYIGGLIGRAENSSIKTSYNAGEIKGTGSNVGAIVGSADTTVTDCYYWSGCGAAGAGTGRTANDMTENDTWMTNLSGFSADIWEKAANDPETTGKLPVLTNNEQEPAPTLTREAKQTQTGFAIIGQPSDPIYETKGSFKLATEGGQSKGAVTWSTSDENIATVDERGTVTIHGVGLVTITATKAGDDTYADAMATYSFTVLGTPISEVEISNLKAPVSGEDPVTYVNVPENANYHGLVAADLGDSTATVEWYDNEGNRVHEGDNFMQNEVYTVVVPLAANDYYSFAEEIQVNTPGFTPGTVTMVSTAPDPNLENTIRVSITFKPTTHEHSYDYNNWSTDPLHHWHACTTVDDCPLMPSEMPGYAAHTGNPGEACSVCGAVIGYEITFDANGGQCDTTSMYTDTTGKLSALPTLTRGGYTFDGWFTEQSGGTAVTAETVYDKNTTLYAHWTAIPSGSSSYMIDVIESTHGTVTASPKWASSGRIVTLTVTPDEGYDLAALTVTDRNGNDVALTNNGDGTYTFKMPASKVTVKATFTKDLVTLPFIDVHPGDWFYDPVCFVFENGLMTGTSATTFEPNTHLSRAMLVAVLHRLEGSPTVSGGDFTDVADGDWYAQAVNWAASVGVVNGFDDGTFQPNTVLTREQMAAILRNYAAYKGMDVTAIGDLTHYSDANSISDWAKESVTWAVGEHLISGITDDTLAPQAYATRAQVAAILQRFLSE